MESERRQYPGGCGTVERVQRSGCAVYFVSPMPRSRQRGWQGGGSVRRRWCGRLEGCGVPGGIRAGSCAPLQTPRGRSRRAWRCRSGVGTARQGRVRRSPRGNWIMGGAGGGRRSLAMSSPAARYRAAIAVPRISQWVPRIANCIFLHTFDECVQRINYTVLNGILDRVCSSNWQIYGLGDQCSIIIVRLWLNED